MIHRRCFLPVVLFALAACPLPGAEALQLRVLTYNIHHGRGADSRIDLARIAAVIGRLHPDVVALQEVDKGTRRAGGVDQAAELARLTGMHGAFGKAMDYDGGQYGEAILSRWPPVEVNNHELPWREGHEPRAALAVRLRAGPDGPEFWFDGTHLDHLKSVVRVCQAKRIIEALAAGEGLPTILAGDLNAEPGSPTMNLLLANWTDAAADAPAPTWPSKEPRTRIDYVLFRPSAEWRVVATRVVAEEIASDHRPVLTILQWSQQSEPED